MNNEKEIFKISAKSKLIWVMLEFESEFLGLFCISCQMESNLFYIWEIGGLICEMDNMVGAMVIVNNIDD